MTTDGPARPGAPAAGEPRLGLRERRKRATRRALADAALQLVAEHGLDHVTVEAIAEVAGVSERTFFNYFASKEDAVVDDSSDSIARVCHQLRTLPAGLSTLEALRAALRAEIQEIEDHPETLTLRMTVLERTPSLFPRMMASSESAIRELTEAVAERVGVAPDHAFPGLFAITGATVFHATVLKWHKAGRPGALGDHLAQAFDLLAAGLPDPEDPSA
ncbi:TetR/AcrR family transcriptional regulator [Kineosporia succinea]|uniref:AcrR family transcriptional regulator n=1 Tax=Kineosporia succinea TaxID=84632 RepID=A0ABT9PD99_9ACTN|nr:TetR/AcrR family transcriptional regulator [Kineosporia succinea]MDP9830673.1 AcrR family transcriptional regulator [Kineosporia succinea]